MRFREITPADDTALAELIRENLRARRLDLPGTVYYDENLYHLSDFYLADPARRFYYILAGHENEVLGGIGLAEFPLRAGCAELQKLYLADRVKGRGLGYDLIARIEDKARALGYREMYLETHDNLTAAIHLYQKCAYREIDRPAGVVHATMNRFFLKTLC